MSIYDNPYLRQMAQMPQFQQFTAPQNNGIQWVQGEEAAKSYYVQPGKSVLLMDSESKCFYIKSVDASGMPLPLRIFDYTERKETPHTPSNLASNATLDVNKFVTYEALENRLQQVLANNSRRSTKRKEDVVDNGE